jgi:hypothetical protein
MDDVFWPDLDLYLNLYLNLYLVTFLSSTLPRPTGRMLLEPT